MEHHQINRHIVSRETFGDVDRQIEQHRGRLEDYLNMLFWWNKRVNLVSRDVSRETVWEHIRHSLLLIQFEIYQKSETVVDAGTGGGLPGLPLAIVSADKQFLLNDIVSKKIFAVRQMVHKLEINNVQTIGKSIESINLDTPYLLISKHAFKIEELWDLVDDKPWTSMVFFKGADFEEELTGIDRPLVIDSYDLSGGSDFYKGKAIIIVRRSGQEGFHDIL